MSPRSRLIVGCALLCLASLSAALSAEPRDDLAGRLERIMARPAFRHAIFGVSVRSLDTGKVLYAKNADAFFVPASTTKLVTFVAAPGAGEGEPVALRISPATSYLRVLNRATTGKPGTLGSCRPEATPRVSGERQAPGRPLVRERPPSFL